MSSALGLPENICLSSMKQNKANFVTPNNCINSTLISMEKSLNFY